VAPLRGVPEVDEAATFAGPLLVMRGELDFLPRTIFEPEVSHWTAELQAAIEVPNAPHDSMRANGTSWA
jgi:hypothetical protein